MEIAAADVVRFLISEMKKYYFNNLIYRAVVLSDLLMLL